MIEVTLRVISVFLIVLMGFIAYKKGMVDRSGSKVLSKVMMNIASPCLTLYTVSSHKIDPEIWNMVKIALLATAVYHVAAAVINYGLIKGLRPKTDEFGIYWAELTFSNSGFLCFPICLAVFGEEAFFYAAISNLLACIFMYTLAIAQVCYTPGASGGESGSVRWKEQLKNLLSIPTVAAFVGLLMFATDTQLPEFMMDTCQTVGNMLVPLSMLVIGIQLGDSKLGNMLTNLRYMGFSALRLLLWPVITFGVCTLCSVPPMITTVLTLTQAMPGGSLPVVFAEQYGKNSKVGAELVFISTLLSIVTIPVACILLTCYLSAGAV